MLAWFIRQFPGNLFTTAVCEAEILLGVALLPDGQRKRDLETAAHQILALFVGRVLPFESDAAVAFAKVVSDRRRLGRPIADFDAQIAAIALTRGYAVVTRDVADFQETGERVVDPWG